MSASLALQRMLVTALSGVGGVSGIYDGPPVDAAPPYLVIGPDLMTDWSTKTEIGHEHRLSVTAWDAGPGTTAAKSIMGAVETAVTAMAGSRDGHRVVSAKLLRGFVLTDAEGWTQAVTEFRLRTSANI
ncbi:hypothetical protein GCM10011529_01080 [Polymorphobacter glacialis]|uniref:DUF3168 domain-containing protein n=1 Tax=Sandarakinorhabdus glacialis TaxID=1614636 RepID=A0A917E2J4_9SPHN|nr:DUF3168 domain-containing protein [Polymorphobacter glacialis]GGD98774.1 hypothetical protein GCM10011529_01080 [Polymorphobacter glacialis]